MVAATGAKLIAHHRAGSRIAGVDRGVQAGDVIKVGRTVELECLDTPGHTMCHICLRSHGDEPALFSGDTLFNAGAGNCHNGGNPEDLYATFVDQLAKLPGATRVYPGHDYIENNLRFTLAREPDNAAAQALLPEVSGQDPATMHVTTLDEEKRINTSALDEPEGDRDAARGLSGPAGEPDPRRCSSARELRNSVSPRGGHSSTSGGHRR